MPGGDGCLPHNRARRRSFPLLRPAAQRGSGNRPHTSAVRNSAVCSMEGGVMAEGYDLAVIGAGMGGVAVASRAAGLGARVALIEEHKVGGT